MGHDSIPVRAGRFEQDAAAAEKEYGNLWARGVEAVGPPCYGAYSVIDAFDEGEPDVGIEITGQARGGRLLVASNRRAITTVISRASQATGGLLVRSLVGRI